jgi:hypothetical protein
LAIAVNGAVIAAIAAIIHQKHVMLTAAGLRIRKNIDAMPSPIHGLM